MPDNAQTSQMESAEVERLRKENEELHQNAGGGRKKSGWVAFFATVLLILFCLVTVGATVASWLHNTALNTTQFVDTVAPLIRDPAVSRALSEEAVNRLFERYDLANRIEKEIKSLPEPFKSAASAGSSGAKNLAITVTADILKSNAFQSAWRAILTTAHTEAVKGLRASGAVTLNEQGEVVLDITDLLTEITDKLSSLGLGFLKNQRIPSGLGQVVLYKNSQLGNAKVAVNTLDDLFLVLPIGAVILLVLGAMVAYDTRRAMIGASVGLAALLGIIYGTLEISQHFLGTRIASATTRSAAMAIANKVETNLYLVILGLVILSLLTVVAAVASGPYPWATRMHSAISLPGIRRRKNPGSASSDGFFTRFAWPLRIGGLCVAFLLLLYLPTSTAPLVIIACAAYLLYLLVIEFLS